MFIGRTIDTSEQSQPQVKGTCRQEQSEAVERYKAADILLYLLLRPLPEQIRLGTA
jgi:hypothetical protein